ncbi:MAG: NAD(P)H-dependent oxidoreductase [Candidatus Micrarchaeia archaeon]
MEFEQIVMSRYACKKFDGKKVPQEKMQKLFECIRFSPSSANTQPWKIKVISDKETKEKLSPVSWNQPQITTCSHLLVFCADTDFEGHLQKMQKVMQGEGISEENIGTYTKMVQGMIDKMPKNQDRLAWAQRQVYLALESAVLGAKALGFDSCPMEGFDSAKYSQILKLPKNIVPSALCPIGYAADVPRKKIRLEEKDVFF